MIGYLLNVDPAGRPSADEVLSMPMMSKHRKIDIQIDSADSDDSSP
jgi:hypothetical protein